MYKLVIADDDGKTTVVPLVRDEITIGRKEGNTIRLTERNISRRHAKLRKANGGYLVEDLQSYNGVKVNGRRIGGEISLKAGDQITIGDYQLALQMEDGATQPDTTAPMVMPNGAGAEAATALLQSPGGPMAMSSGSVSAGPPARLVMTSPPAPGAEFALARPLTRIGRAEELDIWVNHRSISREHAEITNDNGVIRIRDLGSANGVRVNARDSTLTELKPGDIVELGQVRFRFVAPGEQFVFEADRTMQLDAISAPERSGSRAPLFVALGIVGIAVVGAIAVALSGGGPSTVVTPIAEGATGPAMPVVGTTQVAPVAPTVEGPTLDSQISLAVSACRTAINGGDFAGAILHADEALRLRADDVQGASCRRDAEQERSESDSYARGDSARRNGDLEGAYFAFDELPPASRYRQRPEVVQTMSDFATAALERANATLATDPAEALRLADMVRNMAQVDAELRRGAELIVRRARPRAGSVPTRAVRDPRRDDPPPRQVAGTGTGGTTTTRTDPPPGGGGAGTASESGQSPLQAAQACLQRGDNPCVIRALEGRARTAQEFRLLVETYRAMGNTPQMLNSMERFTQRFPSDPRTAQYRQVLLQHGR